MQMFGLLPSILYVLLLDRPNIWLRLLVDCRTVWKWTVKKWRQY